MKRGQLGKTTITLVQQKHCLDMVISYSLADDCYLPQILYNIPKNVNMQEVTLHDCEPAWLFWSALILMFAEMFQLGVAKDKNQSVVCCSSLKRRERETFLLFEDEKLKHEVECPFVPYTLTTYVSASGTSNGF